MPFIDDFSDSYIFPDQHRWADQNVYINNQYGVNPISIGVATFDALDRNGKIYDNASNTPGQADFLTSLPVNLAYTPKDSIYLSFFYQPQGLGDSPEEGDSLVLQFYSPVDGQWQTQWRASFHLSDSSSREYYGNSAIPKVFKPAGTSPSDTFRCVMIPIRDARFLQKGFKFRFFNLVSFSSSISDPGKKSNCDIWNLDYVYLNKNRKYSDTIMNDVALVSSTGSLLRTYESVPWKHFPNAYITELKPTIPIAYRNNSNTVKNVWRKFVLKDLYKNVTSSVIEGGNINVEPQTRVLYNEDLSTDIFDVDALDSAKFQITSYLITGDFDYKSNDTARYLQVFKNYYAYDDGSAELGFGISGRGASNSMTACKFTPCKSDTLRGVYIYFNRTLNNYSGQLSFYLTVWKDNNGMPGDTICCRPGFKPLYADSLNQFIYYPLDTAIYIKQNQPFYIGLKQVSEDFLNIGFDVNKNNKGKYFCYYEASWHDFPYNGSLMIRPVFSMKAISNPQTGIQQNETENISRDFSVYPNPASTLINLSFKDGTDLSRVHVSIYNLSGKLMYSALGYSSPVDISGFSNGLYIVRVTDEHSYSTAKKIIVSH
ncbi:MAG: T9SS type A sorting domain-containing protein [Bacteroidota bacterium]|nr:T9SS type A sorting domain-containing protein [Bacteroidota bacterium]